MSQPEIQPAPSSLAIYKALLRAVIDNRPSGTRQRLAEALGKNRSFVSQIANPAYGTPIPLRHLDTIFHICHFSAAEREAFLAAYRAAHPGRLELVAPERPLRRLTVELPDFGDPSMNERADNILFGVARGLAGLLSSAGDEDEEQSGGKS